MLRNQKIRHNKNVKPSSLSRDSVQFHLIPRKKVKDSQDILEEQRTEYLTSPAMKTCQNLKPSVTGTNQTSTGEHVHRWSLQ